MISSLAGLEKYRAHFITYMIEIMEYSNATDSMIQSPFNNISLKIFNFAKNTPNGGIPHKEKIESNNNMPIDGDSLNTPDKSVKSFIG